MAKWKRISLLALVLIVALAGGWLALSLTVSPATAEPLPSSASFNMSWDAAANGGATMSSSSFILLSTAGQPIAGETSSSSYSLNSGYWAGIGDFIRELFLPLIQKS